MRKVMFGVVVGGLLLAACGGGDDPEPAVEGATAATTTTVERTTTTQAGPTGTCTYIGTDSTFKHMQVELNFTNTLGEVNDLEVTYALLDGEGGTRFFTGTANSLQLAGMEFPGANEKFRMSATTHEDLPPNINPATIACKLLATEEGTDIGGFERATDADTCKVLGPDSRGVKVDVAATSPYKTTTKVQVWWALKAPGGVRFYTDTEVVDLVGAGETFRVSQSSGRELPAWVGGPAGITCAVVGFWDQGR